MFWIQLIRLRSFGLVDVFSLNINLLGLFLGMRSGPRPGALRTKNSATVASQLQNDERYVSQNFCLIFQINAGVPPSVKMESLY